MARTSGCYPEDGSSTLSLAAIARWPRIQARGCRPRHGGEIPSRASTPIHLVVVIQRTRIPARHAGDEGSTPSDHTLLANKHQHAGEVLKVGRSARTREAAGSIPAAGSTIPFLAVLRL